MIKSELNLIVWSLNLTSLFLCISSKSQITIKQKKKGQIPLISNINLSFAYHM